MVDVDNGVELPVEGLQHHADAGPDLGRSRLR